jgi:hypothetical protein
MSRRKDRPGSVAAELLARLNHQFKRFRNHIATILDYMIYWVASLFCCLFAAEVAVGLKLTKRDPLPVRYRPEPATRREEFLHSPPAGHLAPLNTAAGRGVEIFGHFSGPCPDTGAHAAGHRTRKRGFGYFRCIYSPSCKNRRKPSRISNVSVQDWLKLNQPSSSQPPQRRPRAS